MPGPSLTDREIALLHDLTRLSAERAESEEKVAASYRARTEHLEKGYQEAKRRIEGQYVTDKASTQAQGQATLREIAARFREQHAAAQAEYDKLKKSIQGRFAAAQEAARQAHDGVKWEAAAVHDASALGAKQRRDEAERQLAVMNGDLKTLHEAADAAFHQLRGFGGLAEAPAAAPETLDIQVDPFPQFQEKLAAADALLQKLERLVLPRLLGLKGIIPLTLGLAVVLGLGGWLALKGPIGLGAGVAAALVIGVALRFGLGGVARAHVARVAGPLKQALAEADALSVHGKDHVARTYQKATEDARRRRDEEIRGSEEALRRKVAEAERRRDNDTRQADEKYQPLLAQLESTRDEETRQAREKFSRLLAEIEETYRRDGARLDERYRSEMAASKAEHDAAWDAMAARWKEGMDRARATLAELREFNDRHFPDWEGPTWDGWAPADEIPTGVRFGEVRATMGHHILDGIPNDERLKAMGLTDVAMPALLTFPDRGSLLLRAGDGPGREAAVRTLQAVMLRYLTTLPPGKVRFTIIDPVGLGQNFAAFMHLADFNEQFITSRIWTEPQQIDQRLVDLSEHMENVIQKYLRNEYETIEQYNEMAGEVAEPYRILVVANFPANFNDQTARRLVSIAASGPRCGVYTLVSVDAKQQLPQSFNLKDLERNAVVLAWREGRFVWKDPELERYPLRLDAPPEAERFVQIVQEAGRRARDAIRVEVPFEYIAPADDQWWTSDSAGGIDVPLGRAGATRLQNLKLGKGTSQHVLIAGRTGSGKSTLMHALITNLALRYAPDQVELYLIDFKKGVEFKTYAEEELPHARVVAIESEREFGLSVLQRLDVELKVRGDKFRAAGAQDVASYRRARPDDPSPRILLIVDEFQEFFVEDDKVAQEAALLLDRLVRQGRAFGIHVHLGSQTLGGAFSLARSTLGQMAIRIALQCSEADAHLILSEENSAARLLSRPGEAIYNDANGMVEGNHPFQVVWLDEDRREDYLRRVRALARQRHYTPPPQIVFEGNRPADVAKNPFLETLLGTAEWPAPPKATPAWLGDAIAIKDPTAAVFRPQSGSNLLVIGQQDEAALGLMGAAVLGIAAQHAPADPPESGVRFFVLDGSPVDSPNVGVLARIAEAVPHPVRSGAARELPALMAEVAEEVERRQASGEAEAAPWFLFIYDLQRLRDLRKADDDFGFSSSREEKPSPAKQFATILREGPPLGIYTVAWCDTLANLNRTLDRQSVREFEMRVLFQMSANDSSNLIDSPAANKLGPNRAFLYAEEQGRLEKFRPYGIPSPEWLAEVRAKLYGRAAASPTSVG